MTQDDLVGKTLEKCRLVHRLGTGGMGAVYLAEHSGLNRKVAVKILPPDMSRDPEFVARFRREATTAGRLEHPNIVQIYDVGFAEDRHFIVMQYVDGESLSTAVEALGALEPEDSARLAVGILRGLHHAHEQGVVHRDVKPDNVLIARGNQPKLLDFGLAIESEESLNLTRAGMVVGTPYYLSPEQARGLRATPRSDVYSAGVLLYYLLAGKRPFAGTTALAVLNKHVKEKPVPPREHDPKIPGALSDIVLKMMAKQPEDRYPTAAAAADDLENFLAGRPVQAKPHRRRAGTVALAAGLLPLVALVIALAVRGGRDAPAPPAPAAAPAGETTALEAIDAFRRENSENPAAYREILDRYEAFLRAHDGTDLGRRARRALADFRGELEARADRLHREAAAEPDPARRLEAFDRFPPGLLDTAAGARVRPDRAAAARQFEELFARRKDEFHARLREGDLGSARAILDTMAAPADRASEIAALRAELEARESADRDPALLKLREDFAKVHAAFEEALIRRDTPAAYRHVAAFLAAAGEGPARVPGVNYELLLALTPDSTLSSEKLGDARVATATGWAAAKERPATDALTDLQDALDVEWLLRRSRVGLQALSSGGKEIALATFGTAGRVSLGPGGYGLAPKGAPERRIVIGELHPLDLIALAAAADQQTIEAAFASNAALTRAGGVAYLYSNSPDRLLGAARWLRRAAELKFPGPPRRLEWVSQLAFRDVRSRLQSARRALAEHRCATAKGFLENLETLCAGDPVLREEYGDTMAAILVAELRAAFDVRNYALVKQLALKLHASYPGRYNETAVGRLHRRSLLAGGTWIYAPGDIKDPFWTWDGRKEGAPAPATADGHQGFRFDLKRRLAVSPDRARGVTGISFQARFNALSDVAAIAVELGGPESARLTITPAEAKLLGAGPKPAVAPLPKKIAASQWVDVAFVADEGELGVFVDGEEVLGLRGGASPRSIAFYGETDANVRSIRLRK